MPSGVYKRNKSENGRACIFCDKSLTGIKKKFCGEICERYFNRKKRQVKTKNDRRSKQIKKYSIDFLRKEDTPLWFPKETKHVIKEKQFKIKKPSPSSSKKYLPSKTSHGINRDLEREMWLWYWDIIRKIEPLEKGMTQIWKYYDYIHRTQKFVINKPL